MKTQTDVYATIVCPGDPAAGIPAADYTAGPWTFGDRDIVREGSRVIACA